MNWLFISFIVLCHLDDAISAIRPSTHPSTYQDTYFNYQWPLANNGQKVIGDIDDITPVETSGVSWASIDWSFELDKKMRRDTVVAIIDSGVDITHEDLKNRIYLNESECRDGRVPLGPTGDPDKNGFEGDCAGWNFATNDVRRQRLVDDDVGHGTHVAGIIAANINNGIGLSGLSNRIKILPLKVYDSREGLGNQDVISLRVARAINYAIERKVDVINLSLGWPVAANIKEVKMAIDRASSLGIAVVAAAGNDRHDALIYPCAYKSVICVGSININGEVSRFSNFGGHVDILAPGGQILGLTPMTLSSDLFGVKGYDIKFGTSQAAPFVTGAIALLKGIFPEASLDEIHSSLLRSARKVSGKAFGLDVFSASGLLQIQGAYKTLASQEKLLTRPVFKEFDRVVIDEENLSGEYLLTLLHQQEMKESDLHVVSHHSGVIVEAGLTEKGVLLKFRVKSKWESASLKLSVTIKGHTFFHQLQLVKGIVHKKISYLSDKSNLLKDLSTIASPYEFDTHPRFFRFLKESRRLEVYELKDGIIHQSISLNLSDIDQLIDGIGIIRVDIDADGILDYWISGLVLDSEGNAKEIRYVFFNEAGELLNSTLHQGGAPTVGLSFDYSLPQPMMSRFIQVEHPEFGLISIPIFLSRAPVEGIDQSKDVFDPNPLLTGGHIHFLWPHPVEGKVIWRVRTLSKAGLLKKLREQLALPSWEKFEFLNIRLNDEDKTGELSVLFRIGSGILQHYYHLHLRGNDFLESAHSAPLSKSKDLKLRAFYSSLDFSNQAFDSAYVISEDDETVSRKTILRGQFSKNKMRSLLLGEESVLENFSYTTKDPSAFIGSLVKEFHLPDQSVRFFELDTTLEAVVGKEGVKQVFSAPIYRTSFIQGSTFSLRFIPLASRGNHGKLMPTLYVDNSGLFSPTLNMWAVSDERLYVPVKYAFEIPGHCQAMNPFFSQSESYAVLFCKGQNGTESIELVSF